MSECSKESFVSPQIVPVNDENYFTPTPPLNINKAKQLQSPSSQSITSKIYPNTSRPPTQRAINANKSRLNSVKSVCPTITNSATVVLIGDSNCGKTSLVLSYLNKKLANPPKSVLIETYEKTITFTNQTGIKLQIWDFPGDDNFDRFRPLAYANAEGVLICFTLDRKDSLYNIEERWIPELETHCPDAVKIIVGLGSEVRFDKTKVDDVPGFDYCYKYARKFGCKYMECSLIDKKSYNRIFQQLAMLITRKNTVTRLINESLLIPKTRTNTMANKLHQDESEHQKNNEAKTMKRVTSFKKKKSLIRCTIA